jgi:hypothetical protein
VIGAELDQETRGYIRRKLGTKLGKFVTSLERVSVRVIDVNGPRGGVDQLCLIKVVLSVLPSVVVERRRPQAQAAIDAAIGAVERAVTRRLGRRRLKPLHRRRGRQSITRKAATAGGSQNATALILPATKRAKKKTF